MKHWFEKKIAPVLLAGCVLLTGCGGGSAEDVGGKSPEQVAMGRYVEKDIELPDNMADSFPVGIFKNEENQIEVFISGENGLGSYIWDGSAWKENALEWIAAVEDDFQPSSITSVAKGNGCYYMQFRSGDEMAPHLVKSADKITYEEIKMEGWDTKKVYPSGDAYYLRPERIQVFPDGAILAGFYGDIAVYNADGKLRYSGYIDADANGASIAATEEKFAVFTANKEIGIYGSNSGNLANALPCAKENQWPQITFGEDDNIYMASPVGIQRAAVNGSTWEVLVDGSLTSLSMPSNNIYGLIKTGEEFYVLSSSDAGLTLKYYYYDENIPSTPSIELTVYSLEDNQTIRQAIAAFQSQNSDVKVNFRVALDTESSATVSDTLRALNTELLNGKGADILILDGMPINSYIEKGVLENIQDLADELVSSKSLLPNMKKAYETEQGLYTLPAKIGLPVYIGGRNALDAAKTLDTLADFSEASSLPLFEGFDRQSFVMRMMQIYPEGIYENTNALSEEGLTAFLENIQKIAVKMGGIFDLEPEEKKGASSTYGGETSLLAGSRTETDALNVMQGKAELCLNILQGFYDGIIELAVLDQSDLEMERTRDYFEPYGLIGINAASEQKDIANEFIKTLLSAQVQANDLYDGFPVNEEALDILEQKEMEGYGIAMSDGDGFMFSAQYPSKERRQQTIEMIKGAAIPLQRDDQFLEMMMGEMDAFFKGEKNASETAGRVMERAKAYLGE